MNRLVLEEYVVVIILKGPSPELFLGIVQAGSYLGPVIC